MAATRSASGSSGTDLKGVLRFIGYRASTAAMAATRSASRRSRRSCSRRSASSWARRSASSSARLRAASAASAFAASLAARSRSARAALALAFAALMSESSESPESDGVWESDASWSKIDPCHRVSSESRDIFASFMRRWRSMSRARTTGSFQTPVFLSLRARFFFSARMDLRFSASMRDFSSSFGSRSWLFFAEVAVDAVLFCARSHFGPGAWPNSPLPLQRNPWPSGPSSARFGSERTEVPGFERPYSRRRRWELDRFEVHPGPTVA